MISKSFTHLQGLPHGWFYKKLCRASLNSKHKIHTRSSLLYPQRGEPLDQQVIAHKQGVGGHLATVVGYVVANSRDAILLGSTMQQKTAYER